MICSYLTIALFWYAQAINPGVPEIGIGYDILQGNPNGGEFYAPDFDPGFKVNMNILQITELTGGIYQELSITNRNKCQSVTESHLFYDSRTYRKELLTDMTFKATTPSGLEDLAFGKSNLFNRMNYTMAGGDSVFIDVKTVCDTGLVTYKDFMVEIDNYALTRGFAGSVCLLPTEYDSLKYRDFLDTWGTHLVMEIHTGYKLINRYHTNKRDLFETVMRMNETYLFKESIDTIKYLELNTDLFHTGNIATHFQGTNFHTFKIGSDLDHVPIKLKLAPLTEALKDKYWRLEYNDIPVCIERFTIRNLPTLRSNLEKAYRELKEENRFLESKASKLIIPLQWPTGTYGLPMTRTGCPDGGVSWSVGEVRQDTEDDDNGLNSWSANANTLLRVDLDPSHITTEYCMKTNDNAHNYGLLWPAGEYCILKKGNCPQGFQSGSVKWDDEDIDSTNSHSGELPDGSFSQDTDIHYCCRQDGSAAIAMSLPVERDFALYLKGKICQKVKDMQDELVYITFDTENRNPSNALWADYPNIQQTEPGLEVFYCVYKKQFISYNPIG